MPMRILDKKQTYNLKNDNGNAKSTSLERQKIFERNAEKDDAIQSRAQADIDYFLRK